MYRKLIIILLFFSTTLVAQESLTFKQVNEKSYTLFMAGNWQELVDLGNKTDLDFYYLNVRLAVAHYELKQYYKAEKQLKKAIEKNNIDYPKQLLYWTYIMMGETTLAKQTYSTLSKDAQSKIEQNNSFIEYAYVDGGAKFATEATVGTIGLASAMVGHTAGKQISVNHSFNWLDQKSSNQQTLNSLQYGISAKFNIKQFVATAGYVYNKTKYTELYLDTFLTPIFARTNNQEIDITANSSNHFVYGNFTHRISRLKWNVSIGYLARSTDMEKIIQNSVADAPPPLLPPFETPPPPAVTENSNFNASLILPSAGIKLVSPLLHNRVHIGAEIFGAITDSTSNLLVKPNLTVGINNKLWYTTDYIAIDEIIFADYSNGIIFSDTYLNTKRWSHTLTYLASNRLSINATYLFEHIKDSYYSTDYKVNSIIVGAALKF